jgi:hypothetical protein
MKRVPKGTDKSGKRSAAKSSSARAAGGTGLSRQGSGLDGKVPGGTDVHARGKVPGGTD